MQRIDRWLVEEDPANFDLAIRMEMGWMMVREEELLYLLCYAMPCLLIDVSFPAFGFGIRWEEEKEEKSSLL